MSPAQCERLRIKETKSAFLLQVLQCANSFAMG
jgi:hypothetical protein